MHVNDVLPLLAPCCCSINYRSLVIIILLNVCDDREPSPSGKGLLCNGGSLQASPLLSGIYIYACIQNLSRLIIKLFMWLRRSKTPQRVGLACLSVFDTLAIGTEEGPYKVLQDERISQTLST